jgi:hypothetical protein
LAVVSDSGPLIALERIEQLQLLPELFTRILIPPAVEKEVASRWILPGWVVVRPLGRPPRLGRLALSLGAGEREAIGLSLEIAAAHLLVDDKAARRLAKSLRLPIIGTLGLLLAAKRRGLLPTVRPHLDALQRASFYLTRDLYARVLAEAGEPPFMYPTRGERI